MTHLKCLVLAIGVATGTTLALAASHRDAPLITMDDRANLTDVYAFVSEDARTPGLEVLSVVAHVHPFLDPGDGVIYSRFADDAVFSIHIANPATGATVLRYDFRFSKLNPLTTPGLKDPDTILSYGLGGSPILSVGDAAQNFTQTYKVTRTVIGGTSSQIADLLMVPPPNVGRRTTPLYNDPVTGKAVSGATTFDELDPYTQQTVYTLPSGETVFAGQREDGFYADVPGIFDLLDPRIVATDGGPTDGLGQRGGGVDGLQGYNVMAFGIQIPLTMLPSFPYQAPFFGPKLGVGVYASVSRPQTRVLRTTGDPASSGPLIPVNRMGNPLFNEALVALRDKDHYNRTSPTVDASRFATYADNPELAALIELVFGLPVQQTGRADLKEIFIPDVLRVDTTTGPVPLAGQPGFHRLGFIGGDTTAGNSSGWPNGRRFGDDVVDIALTAVVSGPTYDPVILVGDNVNANDQLYQQVFPYSGTPHAGPTVKMRGCDC